MREAHKYAQTFSKRLKILIYLMLSIGVLLLLIGITEEDVAYGGLVLVIAGILLWINYVIAFWFFEAAVEKGYTHIKYLAIPFFFAAVGYLLVIALPNKKANYGYETSRIDFKSELERIAKLKEQGILSESEAEKMRADVLSNIT